MKSLTSSLLIIYHIGLALTQYPTTTTTTWYPTTTRTTWYPTTTTTTTTVPAGVCPDDWIESLEGCFLFQYTENLTWREAQGVCEDLGGYLAEIKSQDLQTFMESIAMLEEEFIGQKSWFIGLSDFGHEGRWVWHHSIDEVSYASWATGYPRNSNSGDDCTALSPYEGYKWTDVSCEETSGSPVCMRDLEQVTTTASSSWPTSTTTSSDHHIELKGGNGYSNGNVFATNRNGYFGPVCDDGWGSNEANTVCRQLGYTSGSAKIGSYYGSVPSTYAMDEVVCSSSDHYLQDCNYDTQDDCGSSEGAGVICS